MARGLPSVTVDPDEDDSVCTKRVVTGDAVINFENCEGNDILRMSDKF